MASPRKSEEGRMHRFVSALRQKLRLLGGITLLLLVGLGLHQLWHALAPSIAHHPQYVLGIEQIQITPVPDWIRSDVKAEALRDSNLAGALSILDNPTQLQSRIREAFEFHPWVASVERIEMRLPASLAVDLKYRKPIAAVERPTELRVELLPIDATGVRLPDVDFTDLEKRYLPRIAGFNDPPLVGEVWNDTRVQAAGALAAALGENWNRLNLYKIVLSKNSLPREESQPALFELVSRGGTRIIWGAAPGNEPAGESKWAEKLKRLTEFAAENGKLDSIEGPAVVDVRKEIAVTPRTAKKSSGAVVE